MILRCVPERAGRSLRFEVFQTVELREGERIPPEFAFFTFSVITISYPRTLYQATGIVIWHKLGLTLN